MNQKIINSKELLDIEIKKYQESSAYHRLMAILKIEEYFAETYGFRLRFKLSVDSESYTVTFLDYNFNFEIFEHNPDKIILMIEQIMRDKLEHKELTYISYFKHGL